MNNIVLNEGDKEKEITDPRTVGMQQVLNKNLLEQRMIFLWGAVEEDNARVIVEQIDYLSSIDDTQPIHFYINSPGEIVTAGNAIYDMMQQIPAPVYTYCIDFAASMAAILLSAGEK